MASDSDDPLSKISKAREKLALFWAAEADGFKKVWDALTKEERSTFVCGHMPHMPKSPKDTVCVCGCGADLKGSAVLFPELVHELLIGDGLLVTAGGESGVFDAPTIMERHATADNRAQELLDLTHISSLQAQGVLRVQETQPEQLHIMVGSNREKVIKVNEWLPEFAEGMQDGTLLDTVTFQYLAKKQTGVMAFVSGLADKYYTVRAVLERRNATAEA